MVLCEPQVEWIHLLGNIRMVVLISTILSQTCKTIPGPVYSFLSSCQGGQLWVGNHSVWNKTYQ